MATAKVDGVEQLKRRLAAMPAELTREIPPATKQGAEEVAAMAKRFAPTKTGALRASIRVEAGQGLGHWVKAGNDKVFYARMVEFGTVRTPRQPYFFPAYRALRKRIKARIARAVSKALKAGKAIAATPPGP